MPFRRVSDSRGGAKIVLVKEGLLVKRLKSPEIKIDETTFFSRVDSL